MAVALLSDPLWDLVEPFLPIPPRRPRGGRPRVSNRACLTGILFVLRSGIPWQMLPHELGCGSGMTCWRRLRDWQLAGVWDLIHFALLDWLARDDQIDWSRAVVDSCSIRAVYGGDQTGPNPTDRAKRGSKRHLICDGRGVPQKPWHLGCSRATVLPLRLAPLILALRGLAGSDSGIEVGGLFAGDGDGGPLAGPGGEMFGEKGDLAGVVGIVGDLAIDRLHDRVRFGADGDGAGHIRVA